MVRGPQSLSVNGKPVLGSSQLSSRTSAFVGSPKPPVASSGHVRAGRVAQRSAVRRAGASRTGRHPRRHWQLVCDFGGWHADAGLIRSRHFEGANGWAAAVESGPAPTPPAPLRRLPPPPLAPLPLQREAPPPPWPAPAAPRNHRAFSRLGGSGGGNSLSLELRELLLREGRR